MGAVGEHTHVHAHTHSHTHTHTFCIALERTPLVSQDTVSGSEEGGGNVTSLAMYTTSISRHGLNTCRYYSIRFSFYVRNDINCLDLVLINQNMEQ